MLPLTTLATYAGHPHTFSGLRTLDLYRVCQIADRLDVSVDWLLGRSEVMELPNSNGELVA